MLSIVDCHVMFIEAFLAAEAENFGLGSDLGVQFLRHDWCFVRTCSE